MTIGKSETTEGLRLCPSEVCNREQRCGSPENCPQELADAYELFGGAAEPIILTPKEQEELERHMAYVEKHGHQP